MDWMSALSTAGRGGIVRGVGGVGRGRRRQKTGAAAAAARGAGGPPRTNPASSAPRRALPRHAPVMPTYFLIIARVLSAWSSFMWPATGALKA